MKSRIKILVVDDDWVTVSILDKYLTKQGYYVVTTNSAVDGAELVKKQDFDLVITDINMPEISGLDFLLWIKQNTPKSQVILMTAYSSKETREFAWQKGVLSYFEKPLNLKRLDTFIQENLIVKTLSSKIADINLFDLVHMISLSGRDKLVSITSPKTGSTGVIQFKNGKPVHAHFNDYEGDKAFLEIMKMKDGIFVDLEWTEPEKITIQCQLADLMEKTLKNSDTEVLPEGNTEVPKENIPEKLISNQKILVVDDDPITPLIIEKYLSKKGFYVVTTDSAIKGADILKKEFFGLIITDINMPDVNGLEFLLWIKQFSPKSQVILMTAYTSEEIKKFAWQAGVLNFFEKPVNLKDLDSFIRKNITETGFSGKLEDISLFDFIKILAFSKNNRLIKISDPMSEITGTLYLKEGNIVHAEYDGLEGKDAFREIILKENGIFSDSPWIEPAKITIISDLNRLLLEGKIILDEEFSKKQNLLPIRVKTFATVKAETKVLEKALKQKEALEEIEHETNPIKKMTIYESGVALGIVIGKTNKNEVIEIMKKYSKTDGESQKNNQLFFFDDIYLTILFNENGTVDELNFGKFYKGRTSFDIGIGDKLQKAIEVYGKPRTCTLKGAVWNNLAFFSMDGLIISSIRLRKMIFFDPSAINTEKVTSIPASESEIKKNIPPNVISEQLAKHSKSSEVKLEGEHINDFTIYEYGKAMEIRLGKTMREEVIELLKEHEDSLKHNKYTSGVIVYEDVSLSIFFDNHDVVEKLLFGSLYKGKTSKGLGIGDTIEKAIEIYGTPIYKTQTNAVWEKIAVFCESLENKLITSIRLQRHHRY